MRFIIYHYIRQVVLFLAARHDAWKAIAEGLALSSGMCLAFMAYAFITGAAPLSLMLAGLFLVFGAMFVGCILVLRSKKL